MIHPSFTPAFRAGTRFKRQTDEVIEMSAPRLGMLPVPTGTGDELAGYGVDAGTGCFYDLAACGPMDKKSTTDEWAEQSQKDEHGGLIAPMQINHTDAQQDWAWSRAAAGARLKLTATRVRAVDPVESP